MRAHLDCPVSLYSELVRWRARGDRGPDTDGDFEVSEHELRLAEECLALEIPRDLLVLAVVRGETPGSIAGMTLAAREIGVPMDVVVFAEELDMIWCGVPVDGRPTYVLGWHRARGCLLPAAITLAEFVHLDDDASDEVRTDARHAFAVYWAPVLEVA